MDERGNRSAFFLDPTVRRLIHSMILSARGIRVVSYPKSGRTWLRLMLHDLSLDPRFTHAAAKALLAKRPEQICSNLPKYRKYRVLFMKRDPRDVVVSFYHQCSRMGFWSGSLKDFIRYPELGFERILAFNSGWCEQSETFRDFMVVRYEALRADPMPLLRGISKFARCPFVSSSDVALAVQNNAFEKMKQGEKSGELNRRFGARFTAAGTADDLMIVRRGVIGGHLDEMDEDDRAFCQQLINSYRYEC